MKKTTFLLAVGTVLLALMSACSSVDAPDMQETEVATVNADQDILDAANNYMNTVFPSTRGIDRQVKNIRHMRTNLTRGNDEQDTLFTVVNYDDNGGFVLMSKAKNGYELYAIDDSHSMEFSDTTFNEGLRYYLSQARAHATPGTGADSTLVSPPTVGEETVQVIKYGPYLNQYVSNWNQWDPFNLYCPIEYDGPQSAYRHCPTGCVPLAVAMVMAYHHWPAESANHTFNWDVINSYPYSPTPTGRAYNEIATLVALLGNSSNLKTEYALDGSSTNRDRVPEVLRKWGYTSSGKWDNSTSADLSRQSTPSIMAGEEQISQKGHEWICDGRMYLVYNSDSGLVDDTDYQPEIYYHFVWGWGGRCNGFYKIGSKSGVVGDLINGTPIEADYLFVNMKCLTDILPNK